MEKIKQYSPFFTSEEQYFSKRFSKKSAPGKKNFNENPFFTGFYNGKEPNNYFFHY
jgi:hypothetical protein